MKLLNLLTLIIIAIPTLNFAQLYSGMEKELEVDYLKNNPFIQFENYRTRPRAPIAGGVVINGAPVRSFNELLKIFEEEVATLLPNGTRIKEHKDAQGRIVWRYPKGTKLIHFLKFKDVDETPFELRMIERVDNKRWAFGVYHLKNDKYVLQNYSGHLDESYSFKGKDGNEYNVDLHHIPLHVCQNCHNNTTSAPHQYNSLEDVGPCEFTAENPKVTGKWIQEFISKRGYNPIEK